MAGGTNRHSDRMGQAAYHPEKPWIQVYLVVFCILRFFALIALFIPLLWQEPGPNQILRGGGYSVAQNEFSPK